MDLVSRVVHAVKRVAGAVAGALPGPPPNDPPPPDPDGRHDSHDMDYQRAALEAMTRDQIGPGGTPG